MDKGYIYKRRLLKLADFLEALPRERFNFGRWVEGSWKGKSDLSCGANACALGWSTTIPSFRKLGLRLVKIGVFTTVGLKGKKPRTSDQSAIDASAQVFGTDADEFDLLFIPRDETVLMGYEQKEYFGWRSLPIEATAKQVAKNIRHFVKWKYGK